MPSYYNRCQVTILPNTDVMKCPARVLQQSQVNILPHTETMKCRIQKFCKPSYYNKDKWKPNVIVMKWSARVLHQSQVLSKPEVMECPAITIGVK